MTQSVPFSLGEGTSQRSATLNEIVAAGRRQACQIFKTVFFSALGALVYCLIVTSSFTASSKILIDPRSFTSQDVNGDQAGLMLSGALVDSEVEVIKSLNVLGPVIDKLDLTHDPEFIGVSLLGKLRAKIFGTEKVPPAKLREMVFDRLSKSLDVSRVNKTTYLIEVDFTSADREKAAKIANAITSSFVQDQVDGRREFAKQSSSWLDSRLVELQSAAMKSDADVQQYRENHNLVLAGGKLVNDQQLADLNSQLANTRIATYQAEAKYKTVQQIIQTHDLN